MLCMLIEVLFTHEHVHSYALSTTKVAMTFYIDLTDTIFSVNLLICLMKLLQFKTVHVVCPWVDEESQGQLPYKQ